MTGAPKLFYSKEAPAISVDLHPYSIIVRAICGLPPSQPGSKATFQVRSMNSKIDMSFDNYRFHSILATLISAMQIEIDTRTCVRQYSESGVKSVSYFQFNNKLPTSVGIFAINTI